MCWGEGERDEDKEERERRRGKEEVNRFIGRIAMKINNLHGRENQQKTEQDIAPSFASK